MKKKNDLIMNISQEELLYLLKILGSPIIPGIDPGIFEKVTERDIGIAVSVAERALIARGFITPKGDGYVNIDEVPLALVGTCAMPVYSVIVEVTNTKTTQGIFWHGTERIIVEHSSPLRGIHKFKALAKETDLANYIQKCIPSPDETSLESLEGLLEESFYEQGKNIIRDTSNIGEAVQIFTAGGLDKKTADGLAQAMDGAESTLTIGFIRHKSGNTSYSVGGVGIIAPKRSFFISPLEDSTKFNLQSLNFSKWEKWLRENIQIIQE